MKKETFTLNIGIEVAEETTPKIDLKKQFDDKQKIELTISKEKVYANYELKF